MNLLSLTSECLNFIGNKIQDVAVLRSSVMSTEVETSLTITVCDDINPETVIACPSPK
jgi:hypothetical protein